LPYILERKPTIITHPKNEVITISDEHLLLSLTCKAEGARSYYWEKENGDIPYGATGVDSNTLTLTNLMPIHAGNYRCVVSSKSDSNFTDYATVTING